ncbi:hypothetical protein N665_1100s0008 [Sinapis alba]|nr:hypothetical protein N665_1100s0008 [Sinapis alba]
MVEKDEGGEEPQKTTVVKIVDDRACTWRTHGDEEELSISLETDTWNGVPDVTVPTTSAAHRRLIRRRFLSLCSVPSPTKHMKKKPKKSPARSPASSPPSPASSSPAPDLSSPAPTSSSSSPSKFESPDGDESNPQPTDLSSASLATTLPPPVSSSPSKVLPEKSGAPNASSSPDLSSASQVSRPPSKALPSKSQASKPSSSSVCNSPAPISSSPYPGLIPNASSVVSEARPGSPVDADAQQPRGNPIPFSPPTIHPSNKTVIVNQTDPTSSKEIIPSYTTESSSAKPACSSVPLSVTSVGKPKHVPSGIPAVVAANTECLSSQQGSVANPPSSLPSLLENTGVEHLVVAKMTSKTSSTGTQNMLPTAVSASDDWCAWVKGTLHNIVNGIWSKHYKDISVSKMEGFAFLFRIPNSATRHRVINQRLWKVPFQFFNEDGLERIAGLVGQPNFCIPQLQIKLTWKSPKSSRKPLLEAVNVQFETSEICRVLVSSPWMPHVCVTCKEIGHVTKRCPTSLKSRATCNSSTHTSQKQEMQARRTRRGRSKKKQQWMVVDPEISAPNKTVPQVQVPHPVTVETLQTLPNQPLHQTELVRTEIVRQSKLGTKSDIARGESSGIAPGSKTSLLRCNSGFSKSSQSDVQPDSSDVESSDSELEEGEFSKHEPDFEVVRNKKRFLGKIGKGGRGPKTN